MRDNFFNYIIVGGVLTGASAAEGIREQEGRREVDANLNTFADWEKEKTRKELFITSRTE